MKGDLTIKIPNSQIIYKTIKGNPEYVITRNEYGTTFWLYKRENDTVEQIKRSDKLQVIDSLAEQLHCKRKG